MRGRCPMRVSLIGSIDGIAPSIHPEAWIAPGAVVVGRVTVDRAASVWYGSVLRADDEEIVIGAECNIQDLCCLHVDPGEPVILEERVSVGHRATVHGAYVAAGALIGVGGVLVGRSRIGAGSLVAGGPGRIVRELTDEDRDLFANTAARYVSRAARHRDAVWRELAG